MHDSTPFIQEIKGDRMKKPLITLGAVAIAALVLSGCSAEADKPSGDNASAANYGDCEVTGERGSLPLETAEEGVLTVATVLPGPGWWNGANPESIDAGFEYCMTAGVAHRAGLDEIKIMNLAWDQFISGTSTGYDVALATVTITDERKEVFDFSQQYFTSNLGVATKKDSGITPDNIRDKVIGVQVGSSGASFIENELKPSTEVKVFQSNPEMFTALSAGQIDVAFTDTTLALEWSTQSGGALEVIGQYDSHQGYGVITPLASKNSAAVDQAVGEMMEDGTIAALSAKYLSPQFGSDPADVKTWTLN
jgi:polar amino acid transport system substrate-binding protein